MWVLWGICLNKGFWKHLLSKNTAGYRNFLEKFRDITWCIPCSKFKKALTYRSERLHQELAFSPIADLGLITREVLQPDDSALFFSEVRTGVALSAEKAFGLLIENFLHKEADEVHRFTDKEIWTKIYKKYFEEKGIAGKQNGGTYTGVWLKYPAGQGNHGFQFGFFRAAGGAALQKPCRCFVLPRFAQ